MLQEIQSQKGQEINNKNYEDSPKYLELRKSVKAEKKAIEELDNQQEIILNNLQTQLQTNLTHI